VIDAAKPRQLFANLKAYRSPVRERGMKGERNEGPI